MEHLEKCGVGYKSLTVIINWYIKCYPLVILIRRFKTTGTDNTFINRKSKNTTDRNHNVYPVGNQTLFTNINGTKNVVVVGLWWNFYNEPSTDTDTFNVGVGYRGRTGRNSHHRN